MSTFTRLCIEIALLISVVLLFMLSIWEHADAAPVKADPSEINGLYIYMTPIAGPGAIWNTIYDYGLSEKYIDGAAIVVKWNAIEPQSGVYDWSGLDPWIIKAVELNKKLAIGVVAGLWTPDWLYQSGVPDVVFKNYDRSPPQGLCETLYQPAVWNPAFLQAYDSTIAQLSMHLHALQIPGRPQGSAYSALRIIKLSGINVTTEELRLNAQPPGGPCNSPDSATTWAAAGYRPEKVIQAWLNIAEATERAFPDKVMSVAVIHKFAFPPINDDGSINDAAVAAPAAPDALTVRILDAAVPMFKDKLLVQWNALSQFTRRDGTAVLPPEVLNAGAQGARVGWQLNGFLGPWGGTGCVYLPFKILPCKTLADFEAIFVNGIDHGAQYIEVHPVTIDEKYLKLPTDAVTDYAPALQEAHDHLMDLP